MTKSEKAKEIMRRAAALFAAIDDTPQIRAEYEKATWPSYHDFKLSFRDKDEVMDEEVMFVIDRALFNTHEKDKEGGFMHSCKTCFAETAAYPKEVRLYASMLCKEFGL